jgi:outer membrane murein-binding lipoprotein Lpp
MQSTLTARQPDPHDMFVIEPDVVLAARADGPDTRLREPDLRALVSEISAGVAAHAAAPKVDTSFRAAHVEKRRGRWGSFVAAFLFALASAVGAGAWHRYGDKAQAAIAMAAPLLGFSSSQATSEPATPPAVAAAEPDQAAPPPEAAVPPASDTAAASAPAAPDQTQLIQSLSHDLAAMGQQVEALKASVAELKAGQEQLGRDAKAAEAKASEAKAFEQTMRAKVSALPPHPPAPARKPRPYVAPAQASAAPLLPPPGAPGSAPVQIAPAPPPPVASAAPQDDVPRPPMPVR